MRQVMTAAILVVLFAGDAYAQITSTTPPDALALLQQVSHRYADAKAYHIKALEEITNTNEWSHDWYKYILDAAEAPGNRYRFDTQSKWGAGLYVSDGKTEWIYEAGSHLYLQKPTPPDGPETHPIVRPSLMEMHHAKALRDSFAHLDERYKAATLLPDEVVSLNGHQIPSFVVRITDSDLKKPPRSSESSSEVTLWIDKSNLKVVKRLERGRSYVYLTDEVHIPFYSETVTTYSLTELDPPGVDPALFSFTPPADAKLVENFPEHIRPDMTGKTAPTLNLKAPDGKQVTLDSFRGKPVLLEFWATWCPPCVEGLPKLARLYEETKDKGLVLLTIDKDEEAKDATDFLAKHAYGWSNFHDDGETSKAFGEHFGIPRAILINAAGKIVYDGTGGGHPDDLLAAIAGLGPKYAFLSPKSKQEPCLASK